MKQIRIVTIALVAMLMGGSLAMAGDANQNSYVSVLGATALYAATATNAATDISAYKGNSTIVVNWGTANASTYTGTVTVTQGTSTTGTFSTVTNAAGTAGTMTSTGVKTNEVDTFAIDLGAVHKYLRLTAVHANATNAVSGTLVAPMKSQ